MTPTTAATRKEVLEIREAFRDSSVDTLGLSFIVNSMVSRISKRAISFKVGKTALEGNSKLKNQLRKDFTQKISISSDGGQMHNKVASESPRLMTISISKGSGPKMVATLTMEEAGLPPVDQSFPVETSIHFSIDMVKLD